MYVIYDYISKNYGNKIHASRNKSIFNVITQLFVSKINLTFNFKKMIPPFASECIGTWKYWMDLPNGFCSMAVRIIARKLCTLSLCKSTILVSTLFNCTHTLAHTHTTHSQTGTLAHTVQITDRCCCCCCCVNKRGAVCGMR